MSSAPLLFTSVFFCFAFFEHFFNRSKSNNTIYYSLSYHQRNVMCVVWYYLINNGALFKRVVTFSPSSQLFFLLLYRLSSLPIMVYDLSIVFFFLYFTCILTSYIRVTSSPFLYLNLPVNMAIINSATFISSRISSALIITFILWFLTSFKIY